MSDARRIVEPQCHEFTAHWNTNAYGLKPWFAADSVIKEMGGAGEATCDALGERWEVTIYTPDGSGIQPPNGGKTANGTTVEHETIREFRLSVEAVDDPHGIRSANFHIRPRWPNMEAEKNDGTTVNIPVPDSLVEHNDAINIRISGSNIGFHNYGELLREAAESVGISRRYFEKSDRHRTSNVQDAARYVRVHTDVSGPIHARTGPITSMAHVLEDDRSGYRKLVQNDEDERGNTLPGYYHTVTLGPDRVTEIFPDHRLPAEVKHYYAREAADRPKSEPLAHPKLEASYQVSRWDNTVRYTDDELDEIEKELDEFLYATLQDAGLDLRAGGGTYVSDDVFSADNSLTTANVVTLDLSEIRHEQEAIVYEQLAGGMSPTEQDTLRTLVTDGGEIAPKDIADQTDRHPDSVYDALGRMNDLVKHEYDSVSLESTYLSELVADALEAAEDKVARATNAAAEAVNAAERGLDERTSAFIAWAESHGVNYRKLDGSGGDGTIELGEVSDARTAREILREGLELWESLNKETVDFRGATARFVTREKQETRSDLVPDKEHTRRHSLSVWKVIRGR